MAVELSTLISPPAIKQSTSVLFTLKSYIWPTAVPSPSTMSDANPSHVSQRIQEAFTNLDTEITSAAERLLELAKLDNKDKDFVPDLSKHPLGQAAIQPALSG